MFCVFCYCTSVDHLWLFGKNRGNCEVKKNVEVTHMLVIFLHNNFWVGLSFPCCCCHEPGVPVQDVVSGSSVVDKVSNFTGVDVYLGTLCEVDQKWGSAEELAFALGKEPVDIVRVSTSVGFVAGNKRAGCMRLRH